MGYMGYTTDFTGAFDLDKPLDDETYNFLVKLSETRRMARNVDSKYGIQGEFYVNGFGIMGQGNEKNIIDYNIPPSTQPGLWCGWCPTSDRMHIEWSGAEKFYGYVEWIAYIMNKILMSRGYVLSGKVEWQGENYTDCGTIEIENNIIKSPHFKRARNMYLNYLPRKY